MYYNNCIAIDIETMPNPEMVDRLPELPPVKVAYGNTKDPEKRKQKEIDAGVKRQENIVKQYQSMALSPLYGKICCVGYYNESDNGVLFGENEKDLLQQTFNRFFSPVGRTNPYILVTHNGFLFDIPFLYRRAIALGVSVTYPQLWYCKRYSMDHHIDTRMLWTNWDTHAKGSSLNELCKALYIGEKIDHDVTKNAEMMLTEDGRKSLATYCINDCKLTWELLKKFDGYLF